MVGEVVTGEHVDEVACLPATWAAAIATTWRSRVVVATAAACWTRSVGSGANSAAEIRVVTSSLLRPDR